MTNDYDYGTWTQPEVQAQIEAERQQEQQQEQQRQQEEQRRQEEQRKRQESVKGLPYETTGEMLNVVKTSNPDKYVVQMQLKDAPKGEYRPVYMTRDEIIKRGGEIPIERNWTPGGNQLTEQSIQREYKKLGLKSPEYKTPPQKVEGLYVNKADGNRSGLDGFFNERDDKKGKEAAYSHPSQFGGVVAASKYLDMIGDDKAREAYSKAFKSYYGQRPEDVVTVLPGEKEKLQGALDLSNAAMNSTLKRFINNPNAKEFDIDAVGGTITLEQKSMLAKLAGVSFNADAEFRKTHIEVGIQGNHFNKDGWWEPEYITQVEADRIKKESPTLYDQLKNHGIKAYNQSVKTEQRIAEAEHTETVRTFEESLKDAPKEVQDAYKKGGINGYNKAVKEWNTKVTKDKAEFERNLATMPKEFQTAYKTGGVDAYNELVESWNAKIAKQDAALTKLEKYKAADGGYFIQQYWRDTGEVDTLKEAGFNLDTLSPRLKDDIKYYTELIPTAKVLREQKAKEQEVKESFYKAFNKPLEPLPMGTDTGTPAKKYSEDIPDKAYDVLEAKLIKYGIPPKMAPAAVAVLGGTAASPIPGDELAVALALLGIVGTTAAAKGIKDYIDKNKKTPEVYAVNESGKIIPMSGVVIEVPKEGWIPRNVGGKVETKQIHELVPPTLKTYTGTQTIPPEVKKQIEQVIGKQNAMVLLDDPAVTMQDITGVTGGMIQAEAATLRTREAAKEATGLSSSKDLENFIREVNAVVNSKLENIRSRENFGKFHDDSVFQMPSKTSGGTITREWVVNNDKAIQDAIRAFWEQKRIGSRYYDNFNSAYMDYLTKRAMLAEAWHSYVASVNPTPINGTLNKNMIEALAVYQIAEYIKGKSKTKQITTFKELFKNSPKINQLANIYEKVYSKAKTSGLTNQQAQNRAMAQVNEALKESTRQATKTDTKTTTQMALQTRVTPRTKTAEATRTAEVTRPAELTKPMEATKAVPLSATGKIKLPKGGGNDKDKRQFIKDSLGAITYRRGKLQNNVWHTWLVDTNGQLHRVITQGAAPEGATLHTGKGSTTTTLQKIRGKRLPNLTIQEDTGASDTIITSANSKLTIDHVGNVVGAGRISDKAPRISSRMPRISSPMPRLTPKMPKLR